MISDSQLRKIAFVFAIIGIAGIVAVAQFSKPEQVKAAEINEAMLGSIVELAGRAANLTEKDGHIFMDVADDSGSIKVVMFERTARTQKGVYVLKKGDNVTVTGKVLLYKGELEVQADEIRIA